MTKENEIVKGDTVRCTLCVHHPYAFSGIQVVEEVKDKMCLIADAWYGYNTLKKINK